MSETGSSIVPIIYLAVMFVSYAFFTYIDGYYDKKTDSMALLFVYGILWPIGVLLSVGILIAKVFVWIGEADDE